MSISSPTARVAHLEALFADEQHAEVHATWSIYQRLGVACRQSDKQLGRFLLEGVIDAASTGVPRELTELTSLGRTLRRRAPDVLAFFDLPGTVIRRTGSGLARAAPRHAVSVWR